MSQVDASETPLDCALDLMRRLPPSKTAQNVGKLLLLVPALTEELLASVDQPLKVARCDQSGRDFLLCDYNRDGDSYRHFQPPIPDGIKPSPKLHKLEVAANDAFDTYRDLYFGGGVSSVYLWDSEESQNAFAGIVLIKKSIGDGTGDSGVWDSIHVFDVLEKGKMARYRITSTIILHVDSKSTAKTPEIDLSGSLVRQLEQEAPLESYNHHVINMGRLVEEMESKMREAIIQIYFGKTKDVVNDLRSIKDSDTDKKMGDLRAQMAARMAKQQA
eukprot:jgi/Hompol1/4699/HPOL_000042-RA